MLIRCTIVALTALISLLPSGAFSAITSSPGIKRVYEGNTVVFQWTFSPPANSVSISNITKTPATNVRGVSNINNSTGVVTLTISNVALWDAGNFSLNVDSSTNSNAVIYVYEMPSVPYINTADYVFRFPHFVSGSLTISCTGGELSYIQSQPSAYAPPFQYIFQRDGILVNNSLDRHSLSGTQLTINPLLQSDHGRIYTCQLQEPGSKLSSNFAPNFTLVLNEFIQLPPDVQMVSLGDNCTMKWVLSYDICYLFQSTDWTLLITLTQSRLGTITSLYIPYYSYSYPCKTQQAVIPHGNNFTVGKSNATRGSLTVANNSIEFHLIDFGLEDAGSYAMQLSYSRLDGQQQALSAILVNEAPSHDQGVQPSSASVYTASMIGICVGLGLPLLICIAVLIYCFKKKRSLEKTGSSIPAALYEIPIVPNNIHESPHRSSGFDSPVYQSLENRQEIREYEALQA